MQILNSAGLGVEFVDSAQEHLEYLRRRQPTAQVPVINRAMFGLSSSATEYSTNVNSAQKREIQRRVGMMRWNGQATQPDITQAYLSIGVDGANDSESDVSTGSEVDDTVRAAAPGGSWPRRR